MRVAAVAITVTAGRTAAVGDYIVPVQAFLRGAVVPMAGGRRKRERAVSGETERGAGGGRRKLVARRHSRGTAMR